SMCPPPPSPTLFPYTTLFRSVFDFVCDPHNLPKWAHAFQQANDKHASLKTPAGTVKIDLRTVSHEDAGTIDWELGFPDGFIGVRSEEHTSELQSRFDLVCRLL